MNDELASIGGFKTEHRGLIDVKVSFKTFKLYGIHLLPFSFGCGITILKCKEFGMDDKWTKRMENKWMDGSRVR